MKNSEFVDYVLSFYGKDGIYGNDKSFIGEPFTKEEIEYATEIRKTHPTSASMEFCGDSADRELVRDIVLLLRNPEAKVECMLNLEGYFLSEKLTEELPKTEIKSKKPKV